MTEGGGNKERVGDIFERCYYQLNEKVAVL